MFGVPVQVTGHFSLCYVPNTVCYEINWTQKGNYLLWPTKSMSIVHLSSIVVKNRMKQTQKLHIDLNRIQQFYNRYQN